MNSRFVIDAPGGTADQSATSTIFSHGLNTDQKAWNLSENEETCCHGNWVLAIAFYLRTVFSHPNAWFTRAVETVSPSSGGE
jgi:hypothetical protein